MRRNPSTGRHTDAAPGRVAATAARHRQQRKHQSRIALENEVVGPRIRERVVDDIPVRRLGQSQTNRGGKESNKDEDRTSSPRMMADPPFDR